jgi:high-affinity nickel-transport protein
LVAGLDLNKIGYGIVAVFVIVWGAAVAIWRFGRIEQRWTAGLRQSAEQPAVD